MTAKFYLDKPAADFETAIYLFVRSGKTTLKFNTGEKIHPKYWNKENPENHFRKFTGSPERNKWLSDLRSDVYSLYLTKKEWNLVDLKTAVEALVTRQQPKDSQRTFSEALDEFVRSRENNRELAKTTIKKYKTLKSHLESYSSKEEVPLRFEIVTTRFFDAFSAYLRNEEKHTTNTVNKYLKTLKTFVHWAIEHEYTKAEAVSTKYKIRDDQTDIIFITYDELMSLFHLNLTPGSALAKVRDVFCFGCFTGQRFSDIAGLKRADIKGSKWVLHQQKGKETVKNEVPLNEFALEILARYKEEDKPLPVISNQNTNKHLKDLGKEAGITEEVKLVRYRGNEQIVIREPKYKLLGTHTARRTFTTLSLEMGMRPEMVMAITGHSDFKTMKRYAAVTENMKAKEMHLYWKKPEISNQEVQTA